MQTEPLFPQQVSLNLLAGDYWVIYLFNRAHSLMQEVKMLHWRLNGARGLGAVIVYTEADSSSAHSKKGVVVLCDNSNNVRKLQTPPHTQIITSGLLFHKRDFCSRAFWSRSDLSRTDTEATIWNLILNRPLLPTLMVLPTLGAHCCTSTPGFFETGDRQWCQGSGSLLQIWQPKRVELMTVMVVTGSGD